ncbi:MAG: hypothetical protein ACT4P7_13550 [Gemmatimonadaceae bacterium]
MQLRHSLVASALAAVLAGCSDASRAPLAPSATLDVSPTSTAVVTTNADNGPGTFRQAVLDANTNPSIDEILFVPGVGTVALQSAITSRASSKPLWVTWTRVWS